MKKIKTLIAFAVAFVFATASLSAYEVPENWSFYIGTDMAYYPLSAKISANSYDHFATITGPYSGLEGRVTAHADYKIATPLGSSWLVKNANIVLGSALEISPVSVKPQVSVSFTPLPFLVFSAGAQAGTGWNLLGLQGMAAYNGGEGYEDLTPFKNYFLKWWAQGTFQFDTGAIFAGDWTHVVLQYSYQVYYEGISGVDNQTVWNWQCSGNKVNGLKNYQCGILAYQMPLVLYRAGVMFELDGYYDSAVYANPDYNGDFKQISISPLIQLKFNKHNTLSILFGFSSRRAYEAQTASNAPEIYDYNHSDSVYTSREWYFNRIALSWTFTF